MCILTMSTIKPKEQIILEDDGKTYTNIWIRSNCELGQMLSHFYESHFEHPFYGPFYCIEGFWYYIKTKERDDRLRTMVGNKAKYLGKKLTSEWRDDFKELILDANYHKINQSPVIKDLLIKSTLPFDHFYTFGPANLIIRPKAHEWLTDMFEELRLMFKEGRKPNSINYK